MELPVAMRQGQHKLGREFVTRYADHNAVDRASPFDLDPTVLTTGDVVAIGAFGDNAFKNNPEWDDNNVHWLKVLVDARTREVFAYQPQIVPGNRVAVPAP